MSRAIRPSIRLRRFRDYDEALGVPWECPLSNAGGLSLLHSTPGPGIRLVMRVSGIYPSGLFQGKLSRPGSSPRTGAGPCPSVRRDCEWLQGTHLSSHPLTGNEVRRANNRISSPVSTMPR